MKSIGKNILKNKLINENNVSEENSFFKKPSHGNKNYFTFADFSNEQELSSVLAIYLENYGLDDKVLLKLSSEAFSLHEKKQEEDKSGDLSEFIYIMH